MRRMRGTTVAVLVIALLLTVPAGAAAPSQAELTILHTSDLHGSVLPWDDARNRPAAGSLAQVATVVRSIRAAAGHPVLVLDSGDTLQGTPLEQFVHVRWGEPSPTIAAMNLIGYQAMAVGNHEFNFGLDILEHARRQAHFPFLSANVVRAASGEPAFQPYLVVEAGPVRIGILGLTTPNIPGWELPEHYRDLAFQPMDEAARRWVPVLRNREGCDLVVVLAHCGFERDLETGEPNDSEVENFGWRLSRVPGIDLLLTGHTHRNISPRRLNGVIVSQPGSRARFVTRIDLRLERADGGWHISGWHGENIPTRAAEADAAVVGLVTEAHERLVRTLDRPVGHVARPLSVKGCRLQDCAALDLIHAVQLEASGAQLSLASLLTDRTPDLPAGPVSWRWIYALYVYPNTLVKVKLTGAQVVDLLEHAARYYDGVRCSEEGGCVALTDAGIPRYNVDTIQGLDYVVDPTAPEGHRVRDVRFRGRPLDLHATFTLVCNNYRAAGGGEFPHLAEAPRVWRGPAEMPELIGDFLGRHDPWPGEGDGNWHLVVPFSAERPLSGGEGVDKVAP